MVEFDAGGNRTLEPFSYRRFLVVGIVGPSAAFRSRRRGWAGRRERDARRKPTAARGRYFYVRYSSSNRAMSHRAMSHRVRRRRRVDPLRTDGRTRRRRRRGRTDTRDTRADGRDGRASLPPRRRSLELPPRFPSASRVRSRRRFKHLDGIGVCALSEPRRGARELPIVHPSLGRASRVVGWVNAVRYAVRYAVRCVRVVDSGIIRRESLDRFWTVERDRARPVPLPQPPKLRDARDLRPAARVLAGGTVRRQAAVYAVVGSIPARIE